jgi:hypothetical protein
MDETDLPGRISDGRKVVAAAGHSIKDLRIDK